MPDIGLYKFTAFPRSIGFVVGPNDDIPQACTDALTSWANDVVTPHNLQAYLNTGTIQLVQSFPDTNDGYEQAYDLAEDLEKY